MKNYNSQIIEICATINKYDVAGVDDYVSHSPKAYKVNKFSRILYDACIDVLNINKTPLTQYLLTEQIGSEKRDELQQYAFNELIEVMIKELKQARQKHSYEELKIMVNTSEVLYKFRSLYKELYPARETLQIITFRIPTEVITEIKLLTEEKLGQTIELAIGYYIMHLEEFVLDLVYEAFRFNE